MTKIIVSGFNDALADYGFRMYRSFARFNPDVPRYFVDFGDMARVEELKALGVTVLPLPRKLPDAPPNFRDMLLHPFLTDVEWDKLCWVDADTLVLRPFDPIWIPDVDFVCHPDRDNKGLVLTCGYNAERYRTVPGYTWLKFATGVWVTRSRDFLHECYARVKGNRRGPRDSDTVTEVVAREGFSCLQLDGNLWNFGRQLIPDARYDGERVVYRANRRTYAPYVAAYSRVPVNGKDVRLSSPALDKFYEEKVCQS